WETAIRAQACDVLRGLLPAGTKTNVGVTANARALEGLVSKTLSNPIEEVRALGGAIRREASAVAPTLLQHARENEYRKSLRDEIAARIPLSELDPSSTAFGAVRLVRYDRDALERVLLALAYDAAAP